MARHPFDRQFGCGHRENRDAQHWTHARPLPTSLLTSTRLSRLIRTLPGSFSTSQLNTHQSETLVRLVAAQCGIEEELGIKGKSGHLASMNTHAAFLSDPSHRIRARLHPKA
jgi:hypothetical protein